MEIEVQTFMGNLGFSPKILHSFILLDDVTVIFMEKGGNSLEIEISSGGIEIAPVTTMSIGIQLVDALRGLRKLGFVHNDIHFGNIIYINNGNKKKIWFIDFGSSSRIPEIKLLKKLGVPLNLAKEIIFGTDLSPQQIKHILSLYPPLSPQSITILLATRSSVVRPSSMHYLDEKYLLMMNLKDDDDINVHSDPQIALRIRDLVHERAWGSQDSMILSIIELEGNFYPVSLSKYVIAHDNGKVNPHLSVDIRHDLVDAISKLGYDYTGDIIWP